MTDRVFLITGASGGIGATTARAAVAAGYRVVLTSRNEGRLNALADALGAPERVLSVPCDVQDWAAQQALVERALGRWGRLDVVFANAGVGGGASFVRGDTTPDEWRAMVLTNVFGAATTARLTLPALIASRGHLLLMGSVVGRVAIPGSFYSATKWAVTGMSESIRAELIGTGVRVTLIEAGLVDTPMLVRRPDAPLLAAEDVARTVMWVLDQPPHVDINEVLVRPVGQQR